MKQLIQYIEYCNQCPSSTRIGVGLSERHFIRYFYECTNPFFLNHQYICHCDDGKNVTIPSWCPLLDKIDGGM